MYAMVLPARGGPLTLVKKPDPIPGPGEARVKVSACGVCRTDLHVVDGELPDIRYPIIPGHEVIGTVDALGTGVSGLRLEMRVGAPDRANEALARLRDGKLVGPAVLCP
jgi:alcohol dehydrogenase, propanol-preferring